MFYLFGKNWIDSYVHVHFRRSNLLTIVQRLKKIYLPSLFQSNKLLSKYEMYISSSETGLYRGKCQRNQFLERARDQALEF